MILCSTLFVRLSEMNEKLATTVNEKLATTYNNGIRIQVTEEMHIFRDTHFTFTCNDGYRHLGQFNFSVMQWSSVTFFTDLHWVNNMIYDKIVFLIISSIKSLLLAGNHKRL